MWTSRRRFYSTQADAELGRLAQQKKRDERKRLTKLLTELVKERPELEAVVTRYIETRESADKQGDFIREVVEGVVMATKHRRKSWAELSELEKIRTSKTRERVRNWRQKKKMLKEEDVVFRQEQAIVSGRSLKEEKPWTPYKPSVQKTAMELVEEGRIEVERAELERRQREVGGEDIAERDEAQEAKTL